MPLFVPMELKQNTGVSSTLALRKITAVPLKTTERNTRHIQQIRGKKVGILLSNSKNREQLKNFGNVYCVVTNHSEVQDNFSLRANHKTTN